MPTKYLVNVPDQMQALLARAASEENINISAVIRIAVADYLLKRYEIQVDHKLEWGGNRRSGKATNEGE